MVWRCFALVLLSASSHADSLISPGVVRYGDASSTLPVLTRSRSQQVYPSSDFLSALPQGGLISQLAFRVDEDQPVSAARPLGLQVSLSTSSASVGNLSTVFSDNIGADSAVVFGPADANWSGTAGQFAFVVNLAQPFFYDPRNGNLLLDARISTGVVVPPFAPLPALDAQSGIDSVVASEDPDSPFGTAFSRAAITRFTFTSVPEPGTYMLGSLVAAAFFALRVFACREAREK
jgi:hypothetical protein